MVHLRMKLHCPHAALGIFHSGQSAWRSRNGAKSCRQLDCLISMRHPNAYRRGHVFEKLRAFEYLNRSMSVLVFWPRLHFPAKLLRHELKSVADAQDWVAEREYARVSRRRIGVIDRAGAS